VLRSRPLKCNNPSAGNAEIATTAPIHRVIQHRGASYLRLFSADSITTTAEAFFQYTHGDWISHLPGV